MDEQIPIRLERQPHRDALGRLREAYRKLRQAGQTLVSAAETSQEVQDEVHNSFVCPSIDPAAGAGSHH